MRAAHTFDREKGVCSAMNQETLSVLAALATIGGFLLELSVFLYRVGKGASAHRMARKNGKRKSKRPPKNE